MRFVIQISKDASVSVGGTITGSIDYGMTVLIGVCDSDTEETADKMIKKMLNLRIFPDENGKTNLNIEKAGGDLLLISQFTLYADCSHGNRPSFTKAGSAAHAKELYEYIIESCKKAGYNTRQGEFGADMKVTLTNDGPFTIVLDSDDL